MLHKIRRRLSQEQGFTLIELLVVILIIGILAAIALPSFLGQRSKGQDASAKSDARNMVSQMESYYSTNETYVGAPAALTSTATGLSVGTTAGSVEISTANASDYAVVAHSKSGNNFTITKAANGTITRTCTTAGQGACPAGGSW